MTTIESDHHKFLHSSDVQGPMARQTSRIIQKENPDLLILGGPPVYLEGVRVDQAAIRNGLENAARIAGKIPAVIFEHHLLRAENWRDRAKLVYEVASRAGNTISTASEYVGEPTRNLEAIRPGLYEQEPPSAEFLKWSKLKREKQRTQPPPIEL